MTGIHAPFKGGYVILHCAPSCPWRGIAEAALKLIAENMGGDTGFNPMVLRLRQPDHHPPLNFSFPIVASPLSVRGWVIHHNQLAIRHSKIQIPPEGVTNWLLYGPVRWRPSFSPTVAHDQLCCYFLPRWSSGGDVIKEVNSSTFSLLIFQSPSQFIETRFIHPQNYILLLNSNRLPTSWKEHSRRLHCPLPNSCKQQLGG